MSGPSFLSQQWPWMITWMLLNISSEDAALFDNDTLDLVQAFEPKKQPIGCR